LNLSRENLKAAKPTRDPFWGVITGHALSLRKGRLDYMYACLKQYGDFIEMFLGKRRTLLVNDPMGLKHVLLDNNKNYTKATPGYQRVAEVLGKGVFTDIGEGWKKGRKAIQPTFNPSKFDHYFTMVHDEVKKTIAHLSSNSNVPVNMSSLSTSYALHVIGRSLLNENLAESFESISKNLSHLIELIERKMTFITPFQTPSKKKLQKDFDETLKVLDAEILKIIEREKTKERMPKGNLIHALLESPLGFDDQNILDQVKTMIFAGHETTANALSWSFYYLAKHPEWQNKIYEEFKTKDFQIDYEEKLDDFVMVSNFIKEVLRIRPPVWSFGRVAVTDDKIHGENVKAGDLISLSPFLMHHHPDYWENPEEFNPDRFFKDPTQYTYFPYGFGPRICMGERLANLEMRLLILEIVKYFRLELTPGMETMKMNAQVSLRLEKDLMLKLTKR
jgi:cytochrome P450